MAQVCPLRLFVQPGDLLLVDGSSWISLAIHIKTWDKEASHVEVVSRVDEAGVETFTARGGQDKGTDGRGGVNFYRDLPEWRDKVTMVLRPRFPFDAEQAHAWAEQHAVGQKYDYLGLLVFTLAVMQGATDRMFCSEATTNYLRAGMTDPLQGPFPADVPADRIAPTTNRYTTAFTHHRVVGSMVEVAACA